MIWIVGSLFTWGFIKVFDETFGEKWTDVFLLVFVWPYTLGKKIAQLFLKNKSFENINND